MITPCLLLCCVVIDLVPDSGNTPYTNPQGVLLEHELSHFTEITPWTSDTQNKVEYSIDYLQSLRLLKYIVINSATSHNHSHTN